MAVQKVKFNDTFIYVDDELDEKETGVIIKDSTKERPDFEDTIEIEPVSEDDLFQDTLTDIFGDEDER